jgi:hypothetical protein
MASQTFTIREKHINTVIPGMTRNPDSNEDIK